MTPGESAGLFWCWRCVARGGAAHRSSGARCSRSSSPWPWPICCSAGGLLRTLVGHPLPVLRRPRPLAILLTYIAAVLVLALFFLMVVPVISQQFNALWSNRQEIASAVQEYVDRALVLYRTNTPADIQAQIDQAVQAAGARGQLGTAGRLVQTITAVTSTVAFAASLFIADLAFLRAQ